MFPDDAPRRVLVVAAHPDDEALGCGGTLARYAALGAWIHVAFLADGVNSRGGEPDAGLTERRAAARAACAILGVGSVSFGEHADNRMDMVALLDVAKSVEALVEQHQPDTVLTHHGGDLNIDHRRVHEAVFTACRPQPGHPVRTVLCFEVPSSTEWQCPGSAPAFVPNWFVDISSTLDRKLAALQAYASEMRDWPHPRSEQGVVALLRWRGASIGTTAAEAFMLGRQRW
jgi:LmbE family N-acetylglucosaminyl deacetylase